MGFRVAVTYDGAMPEPMVKPAEPLPTASGPSTIGAQSALPATTAGKTSPSNLATNSKEISVELGGGIKLEMVLIPAGEFLMGHPGEYAVDSEKPRHRVRITKPFHLGKYLVTQEQWEAVTGDNPSRFKAPKNPVERVSWDDCQQFLQKLNEIPGPHPSPLSRRERESLRLPYGSPPVGIRLPGREHDELLLRERRVGSHSMRGMVGTRAASARGRPKEAERLGPI